MMFKETNVHIGGIIENMSFFIAPDTGKRYDIFGTGGAQKLSHMYGIPLLGQIPLDMTIRQYSDEGKLPVALGDSIQKSYYQNIAKTLLEKL